MFTHTGRRFTFLHFLFFSLVCSSSSSVWKSAVCSVWPASGRNLSCSFWPGRAENPRRCRPVASVWFSCHACAWLALHRLLVPLLRSCCPLLAPKQALLAFYASWSLGGSPSSFSGLAAAPRPCQVSSFQLWVFW